MQDSNSKLIYLIVAVFTLLQILIIIVFGYTPYPDSNGYILIARECVANGEPYPVVSTLNNGGFVWNVGAINMVALFLALFKSITPLLYFYALLKGLSALFVYKISSKLFNDKVAFVTLIIYVLYPANYGESTSVLSELPFMFFILLGIWLALKEKVVAGGMLIAIANWMRPMGLVFILSMVVFYIVVKRKRKILNLIAGYVIVIAFIGIMSWLRTGYFIYQAKTGWMALLQYSVDHSPEDDDYYTVADGYNDVQKDSVWQKRMVDWVIAHPKDYFAQMPKKIIDTYVSDNVNLCVFLHDKQNREYLYEELSMRTLLKDFPHFTIVQWITLYNLLFYYILLLLFIVGCLALLRKRNFKCLAIPLSVVVVGTSVLMFVGHGEARFHILFMPFIIMISSYELLTLKFNKSHNNKSHLSHHNQINKF